MSDERPIDGIVDGVRYLIVVERHVDENGTKMQDDVVKWVTDAWSGEKLDIQVASVGEPDENGTALAQMRSRINGEWINHSGLDPVLLIVDETHTVPAS